MDPSSERSEGSNFIICKEVLIVFLWERALYCWVILLCMRWRGLWCWEDDAGLDRQVVILPSTTNKVLWVFLHRIVYLWMLLFCECHCMINVFLILHCLWYNRSRFFDGVLLLCLYRYSLSEIRRRRGASSIKGERNQVRSQAEDPGWSLCFSLIYHT